MDRLGPIRTTKDHPGHIRIIKGHKGHIKTIEAHQGHIVSGTMEVKGRNAPRNVEAGPPNLVNGPEQRSYDQRSDSARALTPPPSWERGRRSVCGAPGCHSDLHRGIPRNLNQGCHVCGERGCHSFFHLGEERGLQSYGPPQSPRGSENGSRGPREGDRPPPSNQSSPPSQSASA